MANAKHDENHIPTLTAVSSVDNETPTLLYADPVTHRLLVTNTATPSTYSDDFLIGDWVLNVDMYEININHNLTSLYPVSEVKDGNGITVYTQEVKTIDADNILLSVPAVPDLRFDGSIAVIAT